MEPNSTVYVASWLILLAAGAIAAAAIYAVQWMARTASLYSLHTARERLYEVAYRHPAVRGASLYRKIETISSGVIHTVRDQGYNESLALHTRMEQAIRRARRMNSDQAEEGRRVREEFRAAIGDEGDAMLEELRASMRHTRSALAVYALGGNFVMTLLALAFGIPAIILVALASSFRPAPDTVSEVTAAEALFRDGRSFVGAGLRRHSALA